MTVDIGTGTTIGFGTSGFSLELLDVDGPGLSREFVETSHMGTAAPGAGQMGNKTFLPKRQVDPGELTFECHLDPDVIPPIHAAAETITITFPLPAGGATAATWACSGFITSYEPSDPMEDKMTVSITVKLTGPITVTAST